MGKHSFAQRDKLSMDIIGLLNGKEDFIVDIDLLFDNELDYYFMGIFNIIIAYRKHPNVYIQSKDIKKLRKTVQILKKYIINCGKIKIRKKKYIVKIGAES